MYKLIVTIRKSEALSRDEFIDYYEERHMPLMAGLLPSPLVSRRNYVIPDDAVLRSLGGDGRARAPAPYDVMTEAVYATPELAREALSRMFDPAIAEQVHADERRFIMPGSIEFHAVEVRQSAYPWRGDRSE